MEYEAAKSLWDQQTLSPDTKEEEQDERFTQALIIVVFFVVAFLAAIAWAMILTTVIEDEEDGLGTLGTDFSNGGTERSEELPTAEQMSVEVVAVTRMEPPVRTSRPPRGNFSTPRPTTLRTIPTRRTTATSTRTVRTTARTRTTTTSSTTAAGPIRTSTVRTPANTRTTVTSSTTAAGPRPLSRALFCTYGNGTTGNTKFPADGLCDYIFYDSMYKNGINTLDQSTPYSADLEAVLRQAESGVYANTQFGLGFAFTELRKFLQHSAFSSTSVIGQFIQRGVSHLGVIDCPVYGAELSQINEVFGAIAVLSIDLEPVRRRGQPAYLVVGMVSFNSTWNEYFKRQFRRTSAFKPHLFISHGYQLFEDWQRTPCLATPPTVLFKPPHPQQTIHDLRDAVLALAEIGAQAGGPALSLSVTMKGRWTELVANTVAAAFSPCTEKWRRPPASYTGVCIAAPFSNTLKYDLHGRAMRAYDAQRRLMYFYDNEQALSEKLCRVKANYTQVLFGLAVFDLEYEDGDNICSTRNRFGSFSRLKMVAKVLDFFSSKYTDGTQENNCSQLWRS
ncbi:uncharacterized protein LOC144110237 [Amblyomma americanum]|uniref:Uncharacterized protein n=1 Tax=Amblyomma americanum TaxID=6943 RepID=A0AAQ4DEL3_AMBAM